MSATRLQVASRLIPLGVSTQDLSQCDGGIGYALSRCLPRTGLPSSSLLGGTLPCGAGCKQGSDSGLSESEKSKACLS